MTAKQTQQQTILQRSVRDLDFLVYPKTMMSKLTSDSHISGALMPSAADADAISDAGGRCMADVSLQGQYSSG